MLKPLGDRVLVEPLDPEAKTSGGIYLPEAAQEAPREGTVIAVGPGRVLDSGEVVPVGVKVGDIVMYTKYGGNEIKVGGKELLLVDEHSLLCVRVDEGDGKKKGAK
jgi:chaperonin GroES